MMRGQVKTSLAAAERIAPVVQARRVADPKTRVSTTGENRPGQTWLASRFSPATDANMLKAKFRKNPH
jgi:hypothetical protein